MSADSIPESEYTRLKGAVRRKRDFAREDTAHLLAVLARTYEAGWSRTPLLKSALTRIRKLKDALVEDFLSRDDAIEMLIAGTMAGVPVVFFGKPGTAKSHLVRRMAEYMGVTTGREDGAAGGKKYFEYLLTQYTMPEEIFGPPRISSLKEGRFERELENMLPRAEIAFLDEIFRGASQILNTLLSILNERKFHDGQRTVDVPLLTLIGAANTEPRNPELEAFFDRFPVRIWLESVFETGRGLGGATAVGKALVAKARKLETAPTGFLACLNDFWVTREYLKRGRWPVPDEFIETFGRLRGSAKCRLSDRSLLSLAKVGRALDLLRNDGNTVGNFRSVFPFSVPDQPSFVDVQEAVRMEMEGSGRASRY